ncbi:hypothetical protein HOLleu_21128 [Holothuria leucospilota]|uniref:Uncharacterized protein n=1 Tax=Holothuria leucospilota TaxID=206669 RepID=A0A9Q1BXA3_HOLLE|nr:hypothetical protein HOLleu_21128 [Holothuria leucospilota]
MVFSDCQLFDLATVQTFINRLIPASRYTVCKIPVNSMLSVMFASIGVKYRNQEVKPWFLCDVCDPCFQF